MRHERTIGSKGHGLWGMKGEQLPAYIQHVYNDLVEGGEPTGSETYRKAVGIVENWAEGHDGKGHKVSSDTQAKAAAAIAEWEKLRAKAKVTEAVLRVLEAASDGDAEDKTDGGADEATEDRPAVYCPKDKRKVKPGKDGKCPSCGADLSKAVAMARKVTEAVSATVLEAFTSGLHPRGRGGQFVFKSGSSGAQVQGIQSRVGAKVDGQYGSRTQQAVMAFQRRHGLKVDGVVGRQTVAALRGNRKAGKVKVGAMSAADRAWLANLKKSGATVQAKP